MMTTLGWVFPCTSKNPQKRITNSLFIIILEAMKVTIIQLSDKKDFIFTTSNYLKFGLMFCSRCGIGHLSSIPLRKALVVTYHLLKGSAAVPFFLRFFALGKEAP